MKKALALILALLVLTGAYKLGIYHAITKSELWVMDVGYDPEIRIYLDGEWYSHKSYTN